MPDAGAGLLIVTVAAPTHAVDASRPSSPSMARIELQVGILGGGQHAGPGRSGRAPHYVVRGLMRGRG